MHTSPSSHAVIDRWLLQALIAGASAAVLLPFAQVDTPAFGWLPMWLIGLPLAAWLERTGAEVLDTVSAALTVTHGPQPWHIVRFPAEPGKGSE